MARFKPGEYKPARDFLWGSIPVPIENHNPCGEVESNLYHMSYIKDYIGGIYIKEGKVYLETNLDDNRSICLGDVTNIDFDIIKKEIVKKQLKK